MGPMHLDGGEGEGGGGAKGLSGQKTDMLRNRISLEHERDTPPAYLRHRSLRSSKVLEAGGVVCGSPTARLDIPGRASEVAAAATLPD